MYAWHWRAPQTWSLQRAMPAANRADVTSVSADIIISNNVCVSVPTTVAGGGRMLCHMGDAQNYSNYSDVVVPRLFKVGVKNKGGW